MDDDGESWSTSNHDGDEDSLSSNDSSSSGVIARKTPNEESFELIQEGIINMNFSTFYMIETDYIDMLKRNLVAVTSANSDDAGSSSSKNKSFDVAFTDSNGNHNFVVLPNPNLAFQLEDIFNNTAPDIIWNEISYEVVSINPHLHNLFSKIAVFFPKLSVSYHSTVPTTVENYYHEMPVEIAHGIRNALEGGNLKELSIAHCSLTYDTMEILSRGIRDSQLEKIELSFVQCQGDGSNLPKVIANHHRLQCLVLRNLNEQQSAACPFIPSLLFDLAESPGLSGLKSLSLEGSCLTGDVYSTSLVDTDTTYSTALVALSHVLCRPKCQVSSLDLSYTNLGGKITQLLKGIRGDSTSTRVTLNYLTEDWENSICSNSSIQNLDLSHNGIQNENIIEILDFIYDCKNLTSVDLSGNDFDTINFQETKLINGDTNNHLRELDLEDYFSLKQLDNGDDEEEGMIVQLLENNPCLGDLGVEMEDCEVRFSPRIVHLLDVNSSGRVLMQIKEEEEVDDDESNDHDRNNYYKAPLSLWPVLLERSNNLFFKFPERQANAIYYFLNKGPIFFGGG